MCQAMSDGFRSMSRNMRCETRQTSDSHVARSYDNSSIGMEGRGGTRKWKSVYYSYSGTCAARPGKTSDSRVACSYDNSSAE